MYDFIEGPLAELTPTYAVVKAGGVGYMLAISLNTYTALHTQQDRGQVCVYTHFIVREDAMLLYGFADRSERDIFRKLVSVSGVGAVSAMMILSSMSPAEVRQVISEGNAAALKHVKGIGQKTAERIVIDLKDKLGTWTQEGDNFVHLNNSSREEALSAMVNLGFPKAAVEKTLDKLVRDHPSASVEELVKLLLKSM